VDAVFDAAGKGVLGDAVALAGGATRVITLSDPAASKFGVTLSQPTAERAPGALDETIGLLAEGRLHLRAHKSMPMQKAAEAHSQLESARSTNASSSPSTSRYVREHPTASALHRHAVELEPVAGRRYGR